MTTENAKTKSPSRRQFIKSTVYGAFAAGFVHSWAHSQTLGLTRLDVPIKGLGAEFAGFRIGYASDFHHSLAVPERTLRRAVKLLNDARPDIMLLGGDYVTVTATFMRRCMEILSELRAPEGVYAIQGNHDYWAGSGSYNRVIAESKTIKDFANQGLAIRRGSEALWIAGIDDNWGGSPDFHAAVEGAPEGAPRVVFTHNPTIVDELSEGYADLILAGHTHGWQIYIPGLTRLVVPNAGMPTKYRAGFVKTKAGLMYVTTGVGVIYPPVRFWCPPEVVLVTLSKA